MKKFLIISTITMALMAVSGDGSLMDKLFLIGTHQLSSWFYVGIIIILSALLIIEPPRPLGLRFLSAAAGVILLIVTQVSLLGYQINLLEWLVYTETAIILCLEALEPRTSWQMVSATTEQV